jgi:hypothetical protein
MADKVKSKSALRAAKKIGQRPLNVKKLRQGYISSGTYDKIMDAILIFENAKAVDALKSGDPRIMMPVYIERLKTKKNGNKTREVRNFGPGLNVTDNKLLRKILVSNGYDPDTVTELPSTIVMELFQSVYSSMFDRTIKSLNKDMLYDPRAMLSAVSVMYQSGSLPPAYKKAMQREDYYSAANEYLFMKQLPDGSYETKNRDVERNGKHFNVYTNLNKIATSGDRIGGVSDRATQITQGLYELSGRKGYSPKVIYKESELQSFNDMLSPSEMTTLNNLYGEELGLVTNGA